MNPCVEYCYNKFGRSYSKKCDTMCDYARIVKEKDALIKRCKELEEQLRFICRYEIDDGK